MEYIEINKPKIKSCANLALQCLEETGIAEYQTAFKNHIENAKTLGMMPDNIKVIRATLASYNFTMQSSRLENIGIHQVLNLLNESDTLSSDVPLTIFLSIAAICSEKNYMMAVRIDSKNESKHSFHNPEHFCYGYNHICPEPRPDRLHLLKVKNVWLRWDDGIDRSPYSRRKVNPRTSTKNKEEINNSKYYKYFNPNPCGNVIGDCVVRAFAGAMDISWNEAMDKLSSTGETTINSPNSFFEILKREGFVRHHELKRNGRKLTGEEFCSEMNRMRMKGDRIFALVGRSHAAAIVPINGRYSIIDSWDCSSKPIKDFWIKTFEEPDLEEKVESVSCETFAVGDQLKHPVFGTGTITEIASRRITIDFGSNGLRCLGAAWVSDNCSHIAA